MRLQMGDKTITIYGETQGETLILLQADEGEAEAVWELCEAWNGPAFTLAAVSGMDWNRELSPWEAPPAFKKGEAFGGGADGYLKEIEEKILPAIIDALGRKPRHLIHAGYSLAGLFALYSAYRTDLFDGVLSASGSFWYPEFQKYTQEHSISSKIRRIYFSLGDKEGKTKNPVMQPVEERTENIAAALTLQGISTTFVHNPGGHFSDPALRLMKGIVWFLTGN